MRVLVIADPHIPIPPNLYGGAERIAHLLCQEFVRRGHRVDLIAGQGSQRYNGSLFLHTAPTLNKLSRAYRKIWFQGLSFYVSLNVDIVLSFSRVDYLQTLLLQKKPLICRFGNPIAQSEINFLEHYVYPWLHLYTVSHHQLSLVDTQLPATVIHNAVDTDYFSFSSTPQRYLTFLGRLTYNKGVDTAICIAQKTGLPLIIAGNVSKETGGEQFFKEVVQPAIDGQHICYVGPVNDEQKKELLGNAQALLFPIRWDEPFGIVMAESLACGTPVIATRRASTPEVIQDGITGFLCDNEDEMVEAVHKVQTINRANCRQDAEQRFSHRVMADQCLKLMSEILSQ